MALCNTGHDNGERFSLAEGSWEKGNWDSKKRA